MTRIEGSPDGISNHVSMTKVSLQIRGYWLRFDLERDGLCTQDMLCMYEYLSVFDPNMWKELVSCLPVQDLYDYTQSCANDDDDDDECSFWYLSTWSNLLIKSWNTPKSGLLVGPQDLAWDHRWHSSYSLCSGRLNHLKKSCCTLCSQILVKQNLSSVCLP